MQVESGPTGERRVRTLLMFLMIAVFAVWFAYDGWIGYPQENKEEHLEQLPAEEREKVKDVGINERVTEETLPAARQALKRITVAEKQASLEEIYKGPPSYKTSDAWFYFGPTYRITIPLENGRPTRPLGRETKKRASDIIGQKVLAGVLGVLSLYLLWLVIRVFRTRLVLDDGGLAYRGKGPIGWDDMTELDTARFAKKGQVDLIYDDHGEERRLRLDEYHLAKFDEVIDEICARKGFENPLPVEEEKPEK